MPPGSFIASVVKVAMMLPTERNRELIADLPAECAWLSEADVMCVRRARAAQEAGLPSHIQQMVFVPHASRFSESEDALVDPANVRKSRGVQRCRSFQRWERR
jgi:hypothetical protein